MMSDIEVGAHSSRTTRWRMRSAYVTHGYATPVENIRKWLLVEEHFPKKPNGANPVWIIAMSLLFETVPIIGLK